MPTSGDLTTLVAQARESDAAAFTQLVSRVEGVLLPGAATVVGSLAQLQAVARCTVVAMRRGLSACPVSPAAYTAWVEALLRDQLDALVPRAIRRGVPGEDDLSRMLAQAGLLAMRQDGIATLQLARTVRQRVGAMTPSDRSLIDARYRHLQSVEALGQAVGRETWEVARELCRVRAGLHPEAGEEILSPSEALLLETAIAAKPGMEDRQRLMTGLTMEAPRSRLVERQARVHLLLQALLLPVDPERTRRLAAAIGVSPQSAYPDMVDETILPHQLDSQVTFGESGPPKGRTESSDQHPQPRMRPTPPRVAHAQSDVADGEMTVSQSLQILERHQQRTIRLLMLGILVIGLTILGFMWLGTGDDPPVAPPATPSVAPRPAPASSQPPPSRPTPSMVCGVAPSAAIPRWFVRGINFGGEPLVIAHQQWLSSGLAQDQGVAILGRPAIVPEGWIGADVDAAMRRMLETGMTGIADDLIKIEQDLPAAIYELTLWFANRQGFTGSSLRIAVGHEALPLPAPAGGAAPWRQVGPLPVAFPGGRLAVAVTGLQSGDHLAGMCVQLVGGIADEGAPLRIIWPTDGACLRGGSTVALVALPSASTGSLTGCGYRITDEQSAVTPLEGVCRFWSPLVLGRQRLVATGRRADGTPVESAPVGIEVAYDGALFQQWWHGLDPGTSLAVLRNDPRFPDRPDRESLIDVTMRNPDCVGNHHARRIRGYLIPPQDGLYDFGICSDNSCEVYLSTDAGSTNMRKIMELADQWVGDGQWDRFPGQKALHIPLKALQRYYIEILHGQDDGGEILHLGWTRPDGVVERPIPLKHFAPLRMPESFAQRVARLAAASPACPLDAIPGATLAFSTRRLRSAYQGPLVELRRSSDRQVKAWFADDRGCLSPTSGDGADARLAAWKGSASLQVVRWFDQSGADHHARAPEERVEAAWEDADGPQVAFKGHQRLLTEELTADQIAGPGTHDHLTMVAVMRYHAGVINFQIEMSKSNRLGFESAERWDYPNASTGQMAGWSRPLRDRLQVASFWVRGHDRVARINGSEVFTTQRDQTLQDGRGVASFGAQWKGYGSAECAFSAFILFPRTLSGQELATLEATQLAASGISE